MEATEEEMVVGSNSGNERTSPSEVMSRDIPAQLSASSRGIVPGEGVEDCAAARLSVLAKVGEHNKLEDDKGIRSCNGRTSPSAEVLLGDAVEE